MTECAVETDLGIRVPDVAWASPDFMRRYETANERGRVAESSLGISIGPLP